MLKLLMRFLAWALVAVPEQPEQAPTASLPVAFAVLADPMLKESSSLCASARVPGRFWTLNDGGNPPWLFAIDVNGVTQGTPLRVAGVENHDWEAVCTDSSGHLWIGDVGNNLNQRKDLMIYQVEEPGVELPEALAVKKTIRFQYPDQRDFPPAEMNFDCEAMFAFEKHLYLLTKHRSDTQTKLYRLDAAAEAVCQNAILLDRFPIRGQVTDAALHPDGQQLAVISFSGIWIFQRPENSDQFLRGGGKRLLFRNWRLRQIESVAWLDAQTLLIGNEQRDLFRVPVGGGGWVSFPARPAE